MILNLNKNVQVILTKKGAKILNQYNENIRKVLNNTTFYKYYPITYIEGDTYENMLWEIMRIFGNDLFNGCETPFKNNEILIY